MKRVAFPAVGLLVALLGTAVIVVIAGRLVVAYVGRDCATDLCARMVWVDDHAGRPPTEVGGYLPDPLLGWIPGPNQRPHPEHASRITTDAHSVRGVRPYPIARGPQPRIVALGDSYTFGVCVHDEESWPAQLEQQLPGTEVINLGVPGFGLDQMLLRWERDGLAYKPDVVVLGYIAPDLARDVASFDFYAKPRFEPDGSGLRLTGTPVPTPRELLERESGIASRWINYGARGLHLDQLFNRRTDTALSDEVARRIIARLIASAQDVGAKPLVVLLPMEAELEAFARHYQEPEPFSGACQATGTPCFTLTTEVAHFVTGNPGPDYFKCHYRPELHRFVAACLAERIRPLLPAAPR